MLLPICGGDGLDSSGWSGSKEPPIVRIVVQELDTPAGPGSGEPNLRAATDGRVLLSWIERRGLTSR
jgi:hypothetical protein